MSKPKRPTPRGDVRATDTKPSIDDVLALINERTRIRDWIAGLDATREQTPPHVFTRVHADYETRLRAVEERLSAHTGSLNDELVALRGRLERVDDRIRHHQDERVEIDLRAHVGELTAVEVADARAAADEELARLAVERSGIEADVARVTDFFAAAGGTASTAAPPPPALPQRTAASAPVARPSPASFDELSFLQSVVGEDEPVAAAPATSPPPAIPTAPERQSVTSSPPPTAEKPVDKPVEKKPVEKPPVEKPIEKPAAVPVKRVDPVVPKPADLQGDLGIEKESEPLAVAPPKKPARQTIAMQQADMTIEPSDVASMSVVKNDPSKSSLLDGLLSESSTDRPFADNEPSTNPLSSSSSGKSDAKTLKCRECGAMNTATEWYCERCGAELSGL